MKSATSLLVFGYLVLFTLGAQFGAQAQDVELDFHFLKFGQARKAVVKLLGGPDSISESHTLAIKYHRLEWIGLKKERFVAFFLNDRLFRWKKCSAGRATC